jgi:hypothetical protein
MTIREAIGKLRNDVKEHYNDSVLTNKHAYYTIRTALNLLLQRESKKNLSSLSKAFSVKYIPMIEFNQLDIIGLNSNCVVYRSKEKLNFLESDSGIIYKSLSSLDDTEQFTISPTAFVKNKLKLKYNKGSYAWLEDGYLYTNKDYAMLKLVSMFEDDDVKCNFLNSDFKCPDYLLEPVFKMGLETLLRFKQIPYQHIEDKDSNK